MRRRASVEAVGTALLAALGLLGGCSGEFPASGEGVDGGPTPTGRDAGPPGEGDDGSGRDDGGPTPTGRDAGPNDGLRTGQDAQSSAPDGRNSAPVCTQHPCLNPSPVLARRLRTGYDTCKGGTLRRRAIVECPSFLPRASDQCPPATSAVHRTPGSARSVFRTRTARVDRTVIVRIVTVTTVASATRTAAARPRRRLYLRGPGGRLQPGLLLLRGELSPRMRLRQRHAFRFHLPDRIRRVPLRERLPAADGAARRMSPERQHVHQPFTECMRSVAPAEPAVPSSSMAANDSPNTSPAATGAPRTSRRS